MNFNEIVNNDKSKEKIFAGTTDLYIIKEEFNELLFDSHVFKNEKELKKYIYENYNDNVIALEELKIVNFKYKTFEHDPSPKVLIIDNHYKYKNGKYIKNQDDILGINLNYINNKKINIKEIYTFAKKNNLNTLDGYKLLISKFPELKKYIRKYKRDNLLTAKTKK